MSNRRLFLCLLHAGRNYLPEYLAPGQYSLLVFSVDFIGLETSKNCNNGQAPVLTYLVLIIWQITCITLSGMQLCL